jgi:hypothetical protein
MDHLGNDPERASRGTGIENPAPGFIPSGYRWIEESGDLMGWGTREGLTVGCADLEVCIVCLLER